MSAKSEFDTVRSPVAPTPWTRRQFTAALRKAGWRLMKGSVGGTYISPDDPTVLFQMDKYRVGIAEPEHRLMTAVIRQAVRDATRSTPGLARRAWRYIHSAGFEADCAWVGLDPDYIRRRLPELTIIRA